MDFISLKKNYRQDPDYSQRSYDLQMYRKVLDGTLYDGLRYAFFQNFSERSSQAKPVKLADRRPSIRCAISKVVVDDSVALLFGEGRFPTVTTNDNDADNIIAEMIEDTQLHLVMTEAATRGSVGSIAILFKLLEGKPYFDVLDTEFLTPMYDPVNPTKLIKVIEKYKVKGIDLIDMGYDSILKDETYWYHREWTGIQEIYYLPRKVNAKDDTQENEEITAKNIDEIRTITHNLGFVPIVWIKNLPGNGNKIDGLCTFKDAIDTNIELDYQLSQCGRGLKYSQEPLLMIKNPLLNMSGEIVLGEGNTIQVDDKGDAKHIEISGTGCSAALEYAKILRDICLENIHGSRVTPEKMHSVQSGRAMEMLLQNLIWITAKLRLTYGEVGLKNVIKMIFMANQLYEIMINDKIIKKGTLKLTANINLKWSDWFSSTRDDQQKEAITLKTLCESGLMSKETAIKTLQNEYDIVDSKQELTKINSDEKSIPDEKQAA